MFCLGRGRGASCLLWSRAPRGQSSGISEAPHFHSSRFACKLDDDWKNHGESLSHRRRIKTEEKAKVVASVWGDPIYSIPCRASCFEPGWFWRIGLIHPFLLNHLGAIHQFKIFLGKTAIARQGIEYIPPNRSDELCLFFVFILLPRSIWFCYENWFSKKTQIWKTHPEILCEQEQRKWTGHNAKNMQQQEHAEQKRSIQHRTVCTSITQCARNMEHCAEFSTSSGKAMGTEPLVL